MNNKSSTAADIALVKEAIQYGQFADDFKMQLAKPIRDAIKRIFESPPAPRPTLSDECSLLERMTNATSISQFHSLLCEAKSLLASVAPQPEQPNTDSVHLAANRESAVQGLDAAAGVPVAPAACWCGEELLHGACPFGHAARGVRVPRTGATIDEANTALAVTRTREEKLAACELLAAAAQAEVSRLRAAGVGGSAK